MSEPANHSQTAINNTTAADQSQDVQLLTLTPSGLIGDRSLLHAHYVSHLPDREGGMVRLSVEDFKAAANKANATSPNLTLRKIDDLPLGNHGQFGDGDSGRPRLPSDLSAISQAQCRICFSASGDILMNGGMPTLIHPCACDGSIRFCHPECLLQWVRQSGSFWRLPSTDSIDWIHLVIFFFSVCFIVGSIIWMTWLGLGQRMTAAEPAATYGGATSVIRSEEKFAGSLGDFMVPAFILYSIIDMLFLFIAGMELIFTITPLVRKWYRINQTLVIENFTERGGTAVAAASRVVKANVIAATAAVTVSPNDGSAVVNLQASIPCVNEERERIAARQEHIL
ncbi:hypothetical protein BV898_07125 [Hypsibius exemplaris]|uniref:RING-type E3 ubiquitin transferase n=1 Tax=Hypsibius exemplaris TaxID=2072580 RepID=A0A1W0WUJ5_HYPEX|nr:hypothetical protein BV898_07125 [Hypsibius exemplaris]